MPKYKDICPVCGREFDNYSGIGYRFYCCVYCEYHGFEKACQHGYDSVECVKCHPGTKCYGEEEVKEK